MLYPFKVYRAVSKDDEKDIFCVAESLSLKGCLSEAKYISDAIELLEEMNYIRTEEIPTKGRPSFICSVNPYI